MKIIPCTEATYLISKLEEHALTLRERFRLIVHLILCVFCRRFLEQTKIISKAAGGSIPEEKLSEQEKQKMRKDLNLS